MQSSNKRIPAKALPTSTLTESSSLAHALQGYWFIVQGRLCMSWNAEEMLNAGYEPLPYRISLSPMPKPTESTQPSSLSGQATKP